MKTKTITALMLIAFVGGIAFQNMLWHQSKGKRVTASEPTVASAEDPISKAPNDGSAIESTVPKCAPSGNQTSEVGFDRIVIQPPAGPKQVATVMRTEDRAALEAWRKQFDVLLAGQGNIGQAVPLLLEELETAFHESALDALANLESLPPTERLDALTALEVHFQEAAGQILETLGIEPASADAGVTEALDAVEAEAQYSATPASHEQRVARLQLDRERENRLLALLAQSASPEVAAQTQVELDSWYEGQLRLIHGEEETVREE